MKSLLASSIFAVVLSVGSGFAQSDCNVGPGLAQIDCNHPRDLGEDLLCGLAQLPCEYSYFGVDLVDRAPDYAKALTCCEARKSWPFIALMYINGDGTPRDLQKAEAALKAWKQQDGKQQGGYEFSDFHAEFNDAQAAKLQTAIDQCKRGGLKSCRRVDYCATLAENTYDVEMCDAVEQVREEAELREKMVRVGSTLNAADRPRFDQVVSAFKAYERQEMSRGYAAIADGTARGLAGSDQAAFARDNFLKLIDQTVERRELKSPDPGVYGATHDELGRAYRSNIRETVDAWQDLLNDPRLRKDSGQELRSDIADYEKAARESQVEWIKFRDSYAELANSLYQESAKVLDPARSARFEVTKLRIAELRHEPLEGPEVLGTSYK